MQYRQMGIPTHDTCVRGHRVDACIPLSFKANCDTICLRLWLTRSARMPDRANVGVGWLVVWLCGKALVEYKEQRDARQKSTLQLPGIFL